MPKSANNIGLVAILVPVYAQLCVVACGDDKRADVNGNQRITTADAGIVYGKVLSLALPKPAGHD